MRESYSSGGKGAFRRANHYYGSGICVNAYVCEEEDGAIRVNNFGRLVLHEFES